MIPAYQSDRNGAAHSRRVSRQRLLDLAILALGLSGLVIGFMAGQVIYYLTHR